MNATVEQLRNQTNQFLDYVTTDAVEQVIGEDLPLIGDTLVDALKAVGVNDLLGELRSTINTALDQVDGAGAQLAQQIASKLNGLGGVLTASASNTLVTIDIAAGDTLTALSAQGFVLDVGYDALGLELEGGVSADLTFDLNAKLTFDVATGELRLVETGDKLVTVTLDGSLNNLAGEGDLGFIHVAAADKLDTPELSITGTVDYDGPGSSILVSQLGSIAADDFRLTLNGAASTKLGLKVDLSTDLLPKMSTDLLASFALDYDSDTDAGFVTTPSIDLMNITLDVGSIVGFLGDVFGPIVDYVFNAFPIKQLLNTVTAPLPLISEGSKDIGIFDQINIIEDDRINLLDLVGAYLKTQGVSTDSIEAFSKAYSLIQAIDGLQAAAGTSSLIEFGDQHIYGPVLPAMAILPEGASQAIVALAGGDPLSTLAEALDNSATKPSQGDGLGAPAGGLSDILSGSGLELPILQLETIIKLLTAGTSDAPIELVKYDIPELAFNAEFHKFFPVIGPIGVAFDGGFGAKLDVDVGYDTRGLMKDGGSLADGFYFTTKSNGSTIAPFFDPAGHVEAGIFASAAVNVGIGEAGVGGGVVAQLNAYLDGANDPADGKLYLTDLLTNGEPCIFDPISGDFTVRVRAYVTVGVDPFSYTKRFDLVKKTLADFSFGCPPPTFSEDSGLAGLKVPGEPANDLYINAGGRASLRAINGIKGTDTDETFVVSQLDTGALLVGAFGLTDVNGHPGKKGTADDLVTPNEIVAYMQLGNDQMVLDENVIVKATLDGGVGEDLLAGGLGDDRLDGGDQSDRLLGRAGKDVLLGAAGDDYLEGGAGPDELNGGTGFDQVTYENSAAGVIFNPSGVNGRYAGTGGEADGDILTSIEQLTGSHFNDQLIGNQSEGNLLEGLDGADVLQGGSQDDLLIGGGKGDTLNGAGGSDTISYLTSAGQVVANLLFGFGIGGDAQGDKYSSIENVQGSAGNDSIIGNAANNRLLGWYGDDTLAGGAGADLIYAGAGNDTAYALGDGDFLQGDAEGKNKAGNYFYPQTDLLSYEGAASGVIGSLAFYKLNGDGSIKSVSNGVVSRIGGGFSSDQIGVNVVKIPVDGGTVVLGNSSFENLTGSRFADKLTGDYQNNVMRGLAGGDRLDGSAGDDMLIGGAGGDTLIGGDGRDLADYRDSKLGVTVTLADSGYGTGTGGDAQGDKLQGIEDLRGSDRTDDLTGNGGNNRLDPGLSRIDGNSDTVDGGAGSDTLLLDWSRGDSGKGMSGGYALVPADQTITTGTFGREEAKSDAVLDTVNFFNVERLNVVGTSRADTIIGGAGDDTILGGEGGDAILTGIGFGYVGGDPAKGFDYLKGGINYDLVLAGAGNDIVAVNTGADGNLSLFGSTRFGLVDGGTGIDLLNASFTVALDAIVLFGNDGLSAFDGVNYASEDGSAISDFEVLGIVATGFGGDTLIQQGRFANVFATGFGRDQIAAGLGQDIVDGGLDFVYGDEVTVAVDDPLRLDTYTLDFAQVFAGDGDLVEVDYRAGTAGITSSVSIVDTGFTLARPQDESGFAITTNNGFYQSGNDRVTFSNIERAFVLGTAFADQIFGTNLTYGINRRTGEDNALVASDSARGDDILFGYEGNDVIFAGSGGDVVRGGDGDDVLLGTSFPTSRSLGTVDLGEIDRLEGGAGRDVFLLGTTVVLYNDQIAEGQTGHRKVSSENRAEITDFTASLDTIILSALPVAANNRRPYTAYEAIVLDGDTYIYLRDGVATPGETAASHNELIAVLEDVTTFSLTAKYVLYMKSDGSYVNGAGAAVTPPPILGGLPQPDADAGAAPAIADQGPAAHSADVTAPLPQVDHAPAVTWVKQTGDTALLRSALFKGDAVLGAGTLTVDGNSAAVGVFQGDPFGLGSGIVLSTGRVSDLSGTNTIDGGRASPGTTALGFDLVGTVENESGGTSRIYRANLSNLGFDLNSLKLGDASGGFGGAAGAFSGFDIDAVALSRQERTFASADDFNNQLVRIDAFDFDLGSVAYDPGAKRTPADFAGPELRGTQNELPLLGAVTLNRIDGDFTNAGVRALTLGEGGSIGFDLNQTVATDGPLYLYVAEAGAAGEQLTTGLTASSSRLEAPADLSTDLGARGVDGDTTTLTYTFTPRVNGTAAPNTIAFDVVFFSEEFAEFAQEGFNDTFKVMLNGVELARLSDGSFASIDTLYTANAGASARTSIYELRTDTSSPDLIYNPVDTGPAADRTRADGFSKVLRLAGTIDPSGPNVLTIQVSDEGDAYLDSGILIRGGSFAASTQGIFTIDTNDRPIREGERRDVAFGIDLPEGSRLTDPVTILFAPPADIDLGNGAGRPFQVTLAPGETEGQLTYAVLRDAVAGNSRFEAIDVQVRGLPGFESVAPIVVSIDDSPAGQRYTIGNAPETYDRTDPGAWQRAWSHDGLTITHSPDGRAAYSRVDFGISRPEDIAGSDMLAGDLGVSGMAGARTARPQELGGTERLKFAWTSHDVDAVEVRFNLWDDGDVALFEFFDAAGALVDTYRSGEATFAVAGLDDIASMIVSAAAGSFVIDAIDVAETVPPGGGSGIADADLFSNREFRPGIDPNTLAHWYASDLSYHAVALV